MNSQTLTNDPGYQGTYRIEVPSSDKDRKGAVTVEEGKLSLRDGAEGSDDFITFSFHEASKELSSRKAQEIAAPLDELKLSSVLYDREATRDYVATTDNNKLALSQLIESIKSKKSGHEREAFLYEVFTAKTVDQWVEYTKEMVQEIYALKSQLESQGFRADSGDNASGALIKLADNLTSLRSFCRQYCARWTKDISGIIDAYNESMPEVETFLQPFRQG